MYLNVSGKESAQIKLDNLIKDLKPVKILNNKVILLLILILYMIYDFVWAGNLQLDKYQGFNAVPAKGCAQ